MDYKVEQGAIYAEHGFPGQTLWFCDGRTAVQMKDEDISEIDFFSPATKGSYIAFRQRFWGGIRLYLNDKKVKLGSCRILPFGFDAQGEGCTYNLWVGDDRVHIAVTPKTEGATLRMEFYDEFLFTPDNSDKPDVRLGGLKRSWKLPKQDGGIIKLAYREEQGVNFVSVASNAELSLAIKNRRKYVISTNPLPCGHRAEITICFSTDGYVAYTDDSLLYRQQVKRYEAVAAKAPVLKSPHMLLNQFFQLAPMYHESLKTVDVPGAIRAQTTHYWVWGWDSMTSNECSFYWGDMGFIGQMLAFMERYAIPGEGIAHYFERDLKSGEMGAAPAQGMYITMLDRYRIAGGDFKKHYSFAKQIFALIMDTEVDDLGLCKGTSLYPDFRALIYETGNDISSFNNTVSYCAARSMAELAKVIGDSDTEAKAVAFADRMEKNFAKLLFNEETGFFDSSIEATTLQGRRVFGNNAIKWESNACQNLVAGKEKACLSFYEKELVTPSGISPLPWWSDCYDADANQLHCWWPVMSEFYTRLANGQNRPDLINQYVSWIEYWSGKLMCPEGISCHDGYYEVPNDNWNAMPGIWHGYSIRGFYNAVIHSYIGVDFDKNGLNLYPYAGDESEIENLHFGKYIVNLKMQGSGNMIQNVKLNGKNLGAVTRIPFALLQDENHIIVTRTEMN